MTQFNYAMVQFHRDILRNEPVNIGLVVVFDGNLSATVLVQFEADVKRLLKLDRMEHRLIEAGLADIRSSLEANPAGLEKVAACCTGSIQFGDIRQGFAANVDSVFDTLFQRLVAHRRRRSVADQPPAAQRIVTG